jgi:hypothetical protein
MTEEAYLGTDPDEFEPMPMLKTEDGPDTSNTSDVLKNVRQQLKPMQL